MLSLVRNRDVKLSLRVSWRFATCLWTHVQIVLFSGHLRSLPSSVQLKIGRRLEPSQRTLSSASRLSSARLSTFSLRSSPRWALILTKIVKRPLSTLVLRHFHDASQYVSVRGVTEKGFLPFPYPVRANHHQSFRVLRMAMGRECDRDSVSSWARQAAANSALPEEMMMCKMFINNRKS